MVSIQVDNRTLEANPGDNLLALCLREGIYIPNLCYLEGMQRPPASCRLCFVELENVPGPVPACTLTASEGMVVTTGSARVRRLQRTALRLLLSAHDVDCRNCPANRRCALQQMAKFLRVALKMPHLDQMLKTLEIDRSHPCLDYYPNRCVLCGRCVYACGRQSGAVHLTFAGRGRSTLVSSFGALETAELSCNACRACADVCPVGALVSRPGAHGNQEH